MIPIRFLLLLLAALGVSIGSVHGLVGQSTCLRGKFRHGIPFHNQFTRGLWRISRLKATELCAGAERLKNSIQTDQNLKGLIVLPKSAFSPEEHDKILLDILDGCSFEVLSRSQMEAVMVGTRLFGVLYFVFDQNIVIHLRAEPEHGRNDMDLLPNFYKHIIKHRDVLDNLEKQQRLGRRKDLDHAIVYYFGKSHSSDRMIVFPLRHPENEYSGDIEKVLMAQQNG